MCMAFMHGMPTCMHTRRKPDVPAGQTDRELFSSMPLNDTWDDADLLSCFDYLWKSSSTVIPESWQETMTQFEIEFRRAVVVSPTLVDEYNAARVQRV